MDRTQLVLDVDTGVDDALAIILAFRSPAAEVLAIGTVAGNIGAAQAATNTLKVLDVLGVRVPVAVGLDEAIGQTLPLARHVHGQDGMGDAGIPAASGQPSGEHAVDQLIRLAREHPGQITLFACGPLTNVATALLCEPALPRLLKELVIMGGAADAIGNVTAVAEANIWHDAEAARLVFEADWPLTMVGLDVTMQTILRTTHLARLEASDTPLARFVVAILRFYWDHYSAVLEDPGCAMHDPLALAIALDPTLVTQMAHLDVRVEAESALTLGMTVADRRPLRVPGLPPPRHPISVPLAVDSDRFIEVLLSTILADR